MPIAGRINRALLVFHKLQLRQNVEESELIPIVEAILFSSQNSLTPKQIATNIGIKKTRPIKNAIKQLAAFYELHNRSFMIEEIAHGYQIRTRPEFKKWVKRGKNVRQMQLSQSVLETLSIIAYKQPITRAEVEEVRSVDSTYAIRSLLNKKLIKISGKKDLPGKPLLYSTTRFFLESFGFYSLEELPRPEELDIAPYSEPIDP